MSGHHGLPRGLAVTVVGPGRVGTTLAMALTRAGHRVVAVTGGSQDSRDRLRSMVAGVRDEPDPAAATRGAGLVVLATPDDVLADVVTELAVHDGFREQQYVVHVAGAKGLQVLRRAALAGAHVAACHPAQTVPSPPQAEALDGAAWGVTAASGDLAWARDLVEQLGGTPHEVPDSMRVLYHAGLVVAGNAVGAATAVARQLLLAARIEDPRPFLLPLLQASTSIVAARGAQALTGPVVRGDAGTVAAHLAALDADLPELAEAYRHLSAVILAQVRPTLTDEQHAALAATVTPPAPRE